jgi:lipopolysaccharide export system permease protein
MLLFRSLFIQLIPAFLLSTAVLTFVLSVDTVHKLINLIVERGVGIGSVSLMLLYRLPQFLSVTLPLAMVITVALLVVRLSSDLEMTALRAAGMSLWRIGLPIFAFGLLATGIALTITLWLQPQGYSAFEAEKVRVLKSQTARTIQPRILNFDFPGKVLYVQEKLEEDRLSGVFIADRELNQDSMVTVANSGRVEVDERGLALHLDQGTIHLEGEEAAYRMIDFATFRYSFRPPRIDDSEQDGHIWGVPTPKLLEDSSASGRLELLLRLTTPWACLAFSLAMLPLAISDPRVGRTGAYLRALILVVSHYILWLGSKEMVAGLGQSPHLLWLPPLLIALFGLYQILKLDHHARSAFDLLRTT